MPKRPSQVKNFIFGLHRKDWLLEQIKLALISLLWLKQSFLLVLDFCSHFPETAEVSSSKVMPRIGYIKSASIKPD